MNVIGDIAGHYKTLLALIDKMPEGEVISLGDMVDRGPSSKQVVEWFMKNGKAILGNHEHMLIDYYDGHPKYGSVTWLYNGGTKTINSFEDKKPSDEILNWIKDLPLYLEIDDCLLSHSFVRDSLETNCDLDSNSSIIWNRREPERMQEYKMQIAGHNSQFGLKEWKDSEGVYAMCIDTSRAKVLTGLHLPTMKLYSQKYID